jgi:hypothetical protein
MINADAGAQKGSNSRSERRRWERLPLWIPVFVRGTDEQGRQFLEFTNCLNICAGGMLLMARRHVPPHTELSIEVPAAPVPASLSLLPPSRMLKGDVLRVQHSDGGFGLAISFASPIGTAQP